MTWYSNEKYVNFSNQALKSVNKYDFIDITLAYFDRKRANGVSSLEFKRKSIHFRAYMSFLKLFSLKRSKRWAFIWLSTTKLTFLYSGQGVLDPGRTFGWRGGGSNVIRSQKNFNSVIGTYQGWVGLMSSLIREKVRKMKRHMSYFLILFPLNLNNLFGSDVLRCDPNLLALRDYLVLI